MALHLEMRNDSRRKRLCRRDVLQRLGDRICAEEGVTGNLELSVLLCDDSFMRDLNRRFRDKDEPTDVLAFGQETEGLQEYCVLGDIVISLETVETHCNGAPAAMRDEVKLLFCHGLLHLLGYDHGNAQGREQMIALQSRFLDVPSDAAWRSDPEHTQKPGGGSPGGGGALHFGR